MVLKESYGLKNDIHYKVESLFATYYLKEKKILRLD